HLDYFVSLAEKAEPKLLGAEQPEWLRRLEAEHDNLRAALEWSLVSTGQDRGPRICGALQRFWITHCHLSEGREWCTRVLGTAAGQKPTRQRAKDVHGA